MQCHKNITIQEIFATCMESNQEPYLHGAMKEESKASEQTEDIDDILYQEIRRIKEAYVTAESQPINKKKKRQVEYFRLKYPNHEIIRDIGSGINFKRKGFNSILESALKGDVEEIVVTHRDRLCRFGFELIEKVLSSTDGRILVLDQKETSPQQELINDLISIITVFSSRIYGLRSHALKKKIRSAATEVQDSEIQDFSNTGRNDEVTEMLGSI